MEVHAADEHMWWICMSAIDSGTCACTCRCGCVCACMFCLSGFVSTALCPIAPLFSDALLTLMDLQPKKTIRVDNVDGKAVETEVLPACRRYTLCSIPPSALAYKCASRSCTPARS